MPRLIPCILIAALGWAAMPLAVAQASATPDTSALMSESPEGAEVYFISPTHGQTVTSPISVRFGLSNMGVAPAGVDFPNSGHHHLLINVDELPDLTLPVPTDEQHVHFGLGQTETEVALPKGQHTLRLLLGNHLHIPHDPPVMSEVITITVE